MEPGTRWTLAVVGLAAGAGFGLVHQVWRASSMDTAPAAPGPAPAAQAVPDVRAVWHGHPEGPLSGPPPGALPVARGGVDRPVVGYPANGLGRDGSQGWAPAPERAHAAYPAYPGEGAYPAYPAYPTPPAYPVWDGYPQARYGAYPLGPGGYETGYPAYPPARFPHDPEEDGSTWWGPEHHDGPPPPEPEDLADRPGLPRAARYEKGFETAREAPAATSGGTPPEPSAEGSVARGGSPPDGDVLTVPVPADSGADPPAGIDEPADPPPLAGSSLDAGPVPKP